MRCLGLDLGTKSLGIAISDATNTISTPMQVINFKEGNYSEVLPILEKIIEEKKITDIALGLPKNMDNSIGFAATRSKEFSEMLKVFNVNIHLIDERLSTVEALNILKTTGNKNIKKKNKVDAVAASIILENYLKGIKYEK